jgi:hypothetical protein
VYHSLLELDYQLNVEALLWVKSQKRVLETLIYHHARSKDAIQKIQMEHQSNEMFIDMKTDISKDTLKKICP